VSTPPFRPTPRSFRNWRLPSSSGGKKANRSPSIRRATAGSRFWRRSCGGSVGGIIPELDAYELDPAAGRDGVFVFHRMANGWPMFGVQLELHHRDQKITAYRQDRIVILPSEGMPARKVLPAAQAVANLIEKYLPFGAVIREIRLGYHGHIFDDTETQVTAPTWRVLLDDGEIYYIHAISGEVSAEKSAGTAAADGSPQP